MTIEELRAGVKCILDAFSERRPVGRNCMGENECPYTGCRYCYADTVVRFMKGEDPVDIGKTELRQCPFCGDGNVYWTSKDYGDTYSLWIECGKCGCRTPSKTVSRDEMIAFQTGDVLGIRVKTKLKELEIKWDRRENHE